MADTREEEMTRLGLYGLIPFGAGAVGVWIAPSIRPSLGYDFSEATFIYAAVIASYLAGVGAGGLLMSGPKSSESPLPAMIAALVAWAAAWPAGFFGLSLNLTVRGLLLIGVLSYLLLRDLRAVGEGTLPNWYGALRARQTMWSASAILLVIIRFLI